MLVDIVIFITGFVVGVILAPVVYGLFLFVSGRAM